MSDLVVICPFDHSHTCNEQWNLCAFVYATCGVPTRTSITMLRIDPPHFTPFHLVAVFNSCHDELLHLPSSLRTCSQVFEPTPPSTGHPYATTG